MPARPHSTAPRPAAWQSLAVLVVLILAGLVAYRASFHTPFVFDDRAEILQSPALQPGQTSAALARQLWDTSRPLVLATLLLNRVLTGFDTVSYHWLNFGFHIACGWLLFLVLRLTLRSPRCQARYGAAATAISLAVALLWLLHPLQTEAVTYLIQRSESMVSLCLLVTLYATARSHTSAYPRAWFVLVMLMLLLGFLSKPIMVVTPVLVALYDGVFGPGGWRRVWPAGRVRYALLVLVTLALSLWTLRHGTAAGNPVTFSRSSYLFSQGGVLTHYFSLTLWPAQLCLDYYWRIATKPAEIVPYCLFIAALVAGSGLLFWWRPALGYAAVAFWVVLSVTSSILPIADLAFEHRMYLALAAPLLFAVLALHALARQFAGLAATPAAPLPRWLQALGWVLVAAVATAYAVRTDLRNHDYASELEIWLATGRVVPHNPRVYTGTGYAYLALQRWPEAEAAFAEFVRRAPKEPAAWNELGVARLRQKKNALAGEAFTQAVKLAPEFPEAHYNLGCASQHLGDYAQARREYELALKYKPHYPDACNDLASLLMVAKEWDAADALIKRCLDDVPTHANALANRASMVEVRKHLARGEDVNVAPAKGDQ